MMWYKQISESKVIEIESFDKHDFSLKAGWYVSLWPGQFTLMVHALFISFRLEVTSRKRDHHGFELEIDTSFGGLIHFQLYDCRHADDFIEGEC